VTASTRYNGARRVERSVEQAMAAPGIKDVATRAGVSVGTVSNVLNRPQLVSEGTRQRVVDAIAALGFVRNESARHLRNGLSRTLAYLLLDPRNPFFTDVARGAEDAARAAGLALFLCNSEEDPAREAEYLDVLLEQRVRGVLITPVERSAERLRTMTQLAPPDSPSSSATARRTRPARPSTSTSCSSNACAGSSSLRSSTARTGSGR